MDSFVSRNFENLFQIAFGNSVAASRSGFPVRRMLRREVEIFRSSTQRNNIHWAPTNEILEWLHELLVAISPTGKIVGTCSRIKDESKGIISALSVDEEHKDKMEIYVMLLLEAISHMGYGPFEMNLPNSLCPFVDSMKRYWKVRKYWNIRLYKATTDDIKVRHNVDCSPYIITTVDRTSHGEIRVNLFWTSLGIMNIDFRTAAANTEVIYNISKRDIIFGYGLLFRVDEDKWVIGPLIAHCHEAAKHIFDRIILYINQEELKGTIYVYTPECNTIACRYLGETGFTKSPTTWTKYCSLDFIASKYGKIYDKAENVIFANANMVLNGFNMY